MIIILNNSILCIKILQLNFKDQSEIMIIMMHYNNSYIIGITITVRVNW